MSTTRRISIAGLDKVPVLRALYNAAIPTVLTMPNAPILLTAEEAKAHIAINDGHIDFVRGRLIGVDLSGDDIDPILYDKYNDLPGSADSVINALRAIGDPECSQITSLQVLAAANRVAVQVR